MRHVVEKKQLQLEEAKKKLQQLKRDNENIKIDDIIVKFFKKRDFEEEMLNKVEMITSLQFLMIERKESNDFIFENDIKSVQVFRDLNLNYMQSLRFKEKIALAGKVSFACSSPSLRQNSGKLGGTGSGSHYDSGIQSSFQSKYEA